MGPEGVERGVLSRPPREHPEMVRSFAPVCHPREHGAAVSRSLMSGSSTGGLRPRRRRRGGQDVRPNGPRQRSTKRSPRPSQWRSPWAKQPLDKGQSSLFVNSANEGPRAGRRARLRLATRRCPSPDRPLRRLHRPSPRSRAAEPCATEPRSYSPARHAVPIRCPRPRSPGCALRSTRPAGQLAAGARPHHLRVHLPVHARFDPLPPRV